jgi:type IV pilus assembly protein PilW
MRNAYSISTPTRAPQYAHGLSLIELMVAMVLGLVLVAGAAKVYVGGRRSHDLNESVARMQESARFALAVLEPDIRLSNNWGLMKGASGIQGQVDQNSAPNALGGSSNNCGKNFALDLANNIEGANNSFALGVGRNATTCATTRTPLATGDTLTIRRAAMSTTATGPLKLCTSRVSGLLVSDSSGCLGAPNGQVSDLLVHSYYVATNSDAGTDIPSLHRMTLTTGAGGTPMFTDVELISGIEDMQVQFGIDDNNSGIATHYINPAVAGGFTGQVVSVRLWILVRAETPEADFIDDTQYAYGDRTAGSAYDLTAAASAGKVYVPSSSPGTAVNDVKHYRRLLVSRTIQIRNALGT